MTKPQPQKDLPTPEQKKLSKRLKKAHTLKITRDKQITEADEIRVLLGGGGMAIHDWQARYLLSSNLVAAFSMKQEKAKLNDNIIKVLYITTK